MTKNKIIDIINQLEHKDIEALKNIYMYRCLNEDQLFKLIYNDNNTNKLYVRDKIQKMLNLNLIESVFYGAELPVYFLTSTGIDVVRTFYDLPYNIFDIEKKIIKRGYYRASELKINPKFINHQMQLNNFVINFSEKLNNRLVWKYYDEKYMSQYVNIRPDGLIQILDVDLFLEIDMATESKNQLYEKWENYRNFLMSSEYAYKERKIIVLFILNNSEKIQERKDLIRYTITERILDLIDDNFEIYIGTQEEILNVIFKKIIPHSIGKDIILNEIKNILEVNHFFNVDDGSIIKNFLIDTNYSFYIRKIDRRNYLIVENNKIQEYLLDEYYFSPVSVLKKIAYLDRNNSIFKSKLGRELSYIVVAKNEEELFHDLKIADLIGTKNVYFTTINRLKNMNFYEAIFQFDYLGNIYHFIDGGLQNRVFERKI